MFFFNVSISIANSMKWYRNVQPCTKDTSGDYTHQICLWPFILDHLYNIIYMTILCVFFIIGSWNYISRSLEFRRCQAQDFHLQMFLHHRVQAKLTWEFCRWWMIGYWYYNESLEAERSRGCRMKSFQPAGHLEPKPFEFTPLLLPTRWGVKRFLDKRVLGVRLPTRHAAKC